MPSKIDSQGNDRALMVVLLMLPVLLIASSVSFTNCFCSCLHCRASLESLVIVGVVVTVVLLVLPLLLAASSFSSIQMACSCSYSRADLKSLVAVCVLIMV